MKLSNLLLTLSILAATDVCAQSKVKTITIKNEVYYITTEVGIPVVGLYKYEGKKDPIVQLNADGTGLFQLHGMSQTPMEWGMECTADGTPKKNATDFGAVYLLWYQLKAKHKGSSWESGEVGKWDAVQFSIHNDTGKMYILGEREKVN